MDSVIRICKALMFIGAAAFISNILFFSGETKTSSQSNPTTQQPTTAALEPTSKPAAQQPPKEFKPTAAMKAAIDPGDSFRSDGWRFEYGDFTDRKIDVWVYWPANQSVTLEAVEMMGKAMVQDSVKRLTRAGFDPKKNGTNITYFFRKDLGGDRVMMLGSAGYTGIVDGYYYSAPK
ncbi:hypothetical protein CFI10_11195 [Marinobacterium iners]|uniref:hypothetical protein n=1 Tax=Marinobacterium iners TaxID=48076 RepID=UPI001A8F9981|nr:hypothetical protein [Marinobacterium iners]QSR35553.1 hypothetical protein CFI10_11195 [Marinobacterium iners]